MKNTNFQGILSEKKLSLEQVAEMTTIDIQVLRNIANAVYPMSPGVSHLFHLLIDGMTSEEWRRRTNQYFVEIVSPKSLKLAHHKKIAELGNNKEPILKDKVGQKTYQDVLEYRKNHRIYIPCIRCGADSLNGRHRGGSCPPIDIEDE